MEPKNIIIISFVWVGIVFIFSSVLVYSQFSSTQYAQQNIQPSNIQHNQMVRKNQSTEKHDNTIVKSTVCIESSESPCELPENTVRPVVRIIP